MTVHLNAPPDIAKVFDATKGYVAWQDDQVTLTTGTLELGEGIITYPFKYSHLVRIKAPIGPLIGFGIPAGSVGFDAGEFGAVWKPEHILCFFDGRKPEAKRWGKPICLRYIGMLGFKWGLANTDNNLLTRPTYGDGVIGEPQLETEGVTIEHDFKAVLSVAEWSRKKVTLVWKSEGQILTWTGGASYSFLGIDVPLADDGAAHIATNDGMIALARDPDDKTKTIVSFTPRQ